MLYNVVLVSAVQRSVVASMLLQMALFHCFVWLSNIPLYICTIFFIHSSVSGHLGCFNVLATLNSVAMSTGVHVSF